LDTISKERRSELMKRVKRANTRPEVLVRKELHRRGLRFVIADSRLPGSPDLVFPKYKAVLFVHGCFWHGHHCKKGRLPSSNVDFWTKKIAGNRARDTRKEQDLKLLGWRVLLVWECEVKMGITSSCFFDELAAKIRHASPGE
jgi:DNA mismatch endonuclease (patch repair protein)